MSRLISLLRRTSKMHTRGDLSLRPKNLLRMPATMHLATTDLQLQDRSSQTPVVSKTRASQSQKGKGTRSRARLELASWIHMLRT